MPSNGIYGCTRNRNPSNLFSSFPPESCLSISVASCECFISHACLDVADLNGIPRVILAPCHVARILSLLKPFRDAVIIFLVVNAIGQAGQDMLLVNCRRANNCVLCHPQSCGRSGHDDDMNRRAGEIGTFNCYSKAPAGQTTADCMQLSDQSRMSSIRCCPCFQ
jgi:hypothetical protein